MKKLLSLTFALIIAATCLFAVVPASADIETWYVKTGNGKGLNVRDMETGEKIGVIPYGESVAVEWFHDPWAIIMWGSMGSAKVKAEFLVRSKPAKYQPAVDPNSKVNGKGTVLTDSALGAETVEGLNHQFSSLKYVDEPYTVAVMPDTRTGTARFRWAPSKNATLISQLPAGYQLTVLAANSNWLMVEDPNTSQIGYIAAKFAVVK